MQIAPQRAFYALSVRYCVVRPLPIAAHIRGPSKHGNNTFSNSNKLTRFGFRLKNCFLIDSSLRKEKFRSHQGIRESHVSFKSLDYGVYLKNIHQYIITIFLVNVIKNLNNSWTNDGRLDKITITRCIMQISFRRKVFVSLYEWLYHDCGFIRESLNDEIYITFGTD